MTCPGCENHFCCKCRLPETHNCAALSAVKQCARDKTVAAVLEGKCVTSTLAEKV